MTAKEIMTANNINPCEFKERVLDNLNRNAHRVYLFKLMEMIKTNPELKEACDLFNETF